MNGATQSDIWPYIFPRDLLDLMMPIYRTFRKFCEFDETLRGTCTHIPNSRVLSVNYRRVVNNMKYIYEKPYLMAIQTKM